MDIDSDASDDYNYTLSAKRAKSVKLYREYGRFKFKINN